MTPADLMAFSESPPPTTETAPESATALATATVPLSKGGISKMPMGPFQMMVLADAMTSAYASMVLGPISTADFAIGDFGDHFAGRAGFEFGGHHVIDGQHQLGAQIMRVTCLGELDLVVFHQRLAGGLALRLEEGVRHGAADEQFVDDLPGSE